MVKIVFDYGNLRGEMAKQNITQEKLAELSGICKTTIHTHLKNGTKFDCEQAVMIARVLKLEDMDPYFFTYKLQKS